MSMVESVLGRLGYARHEAIALRKEPTFGTVLPAIRNNGNGQLENPNVPIDQNTLASILTGGPTYAGPAVSERSSMRSTVVYACVALNANTGGALPLPVFQKTDNGPRLAEELRQSTILNAAPNPDIALTRFTWVSLMITHLQLAGNHYSAIEYDGAGRVVGLTPLQPWNVQVGVKRVGLGFRRAYRVMLSDGTTYDLDQEDVLHVPGVGFDGIKGISPIQMAGRQSIGSHLAMEESAGRILANGARISGIVTQGAGKPLSPDGMQELKGEFRRQYQSAINSGEVVFLDNGMTFKEAQMTLKDAELLESRKFSAVDICRIFGVPPFLIGETADMTAWGSGLEQITNGFLLFGLNRWLEPIEAEINLKLFAGTDYYARFDRDALNAMNTAAQADAFLKRIQSGWSINQALRKQHMPDVNGGDEPLVPVNLQTLSRALSNDPKPPITEGQKVAA